MKKQTAFITIAFIAINIVIFLLTDLPGDAYTENIIRQYAMFRPALLAGGEWFRLFTACFLHFGIEHLGGNMLALGALGYRLEARLGHLRFLLLYLVSGVGANLFSMWMNLMKGEAPAYAAGASGAISGIFGGLIALFLFDRSGIDGVGLPQMIAAVLFLLYSGSKDGSVDVYAHIGGLLIGFLTGLILMLISGLFRHHHAD